MNKDVSLSQDELKVIVGIMRSIQIPYNQSRLVNPIIEKLDAFIDKEKLDTK